MRVAINTAIEARGHSGTSTAVSQIRDVFFDWTDWDLRELRPTVRSSTRVGRLVDSLRWDFRQFAVEADHQQSRVLIFPTNVGRPRHGQRSILVMHDVMVLEHSREFDRGYASTSRVSFPVSARAHDVVVTPSTWSANAIRKRFSPTRLEVIPWYAPERVREPVPRDERRNEFLVVAPTGGHKRVHLALEALAVVNALSGRQLRLRLIGAAGTGEGLYQEALTRHSQGGQIVRRSEFVDRKELNTDYATSLALIVPSLDEGFGLPLLEAAASGTPVIHTRLGAMQEVLPIPGESSDHGVLDLVVQMLETLDEAHWEQRVEAGYDAVERHSKQNFVLAWRRLLTGLSSED